MELVLIWAFQSQITRSKMIVRQRLSTLTIRCKVIVNEALSKYLTRRKWISKSGPNELPFRTQVKMCSSLIQMLLRLCRRRDPAVTQGQLQRLLSRLQDLRATQPIIPLIGQKWTCKSRLRHPWKVVTTWTRITKNWRSCMRRWWRLIKARNTRESTKTYWLQIREQLTKAEVEQNNWLLIIRSPLRRLLGRWVRGLSCMKLQPCPRDRCLVKGCKIFRSRPRTFEKAQIVKVTLTNL